MMAIESRQMSWGGAGDELAPSQLAPLLLITSFLIQTDPVLLLI